MKVSRYSLLKFFYYRMDMIVGYADICKYLWGDSEVTPKRKKNIHTYIHDLRKVFEKDKDFDLTITNEGNGTYCFHIDAGEEYLEMISNLHENKLYQVRSEIKRLIEVEGELAIKEDLLEKKEADIEEMYRLSQTALKKDIID